MPVKNWETFLVAATAYSKNLATNKAFKAIKRSIDTGLRDRELLESLPEFSILKEDKRWPKVVNRIDSLKEVYIGNIENEQVLRELQEMWRMDQLALSSYEENISLLDSNASHEDYAKLFKPVEERWEINKNKLDSIISIHGWPGNKLVGPDGAKLSWAIPQHSPDMLFKEKCLSLIKEAVTKGDVNPNHYAELHDRIKRDKWEKQTFGASMGQYGPHPIENASLVNQRRFEIGLPEPIEVYALYHGKDYQVPSQHEAKLDSITSLNEAQNLYKKFETNVEKEEVDSATSYLQEAINHFGDISNDQLYQAAIKLSQVDQGNSKQLSVKILKVLIWRNWEGQYAILENDSLKTLQGSEDWKTVVELLDRD